MNGAMNTENLKYTKITKCRLCGGEIERILSLGDYCLTGVFPMSDKEKLTCGPLELVKCRNEHYKYSCGLVQLRHSYKPTELYGANYGYRSGLNKSMVEHLKDISKQIQKKVVLNSGDIVLDIGANDGTLLSFYPRNQNIAIVGLDPSLEKFLEFYRPDIETVADYFSAKLFQGIFGNRKAKIVTSIAMLYDLEDPIQFISEVASILSNDGIFHFEQSYLPAMIENCGYDTICHEHIEYYGLRQIKWMTDKTDLKIIDIEENDINGGSFGVTVAKASSSYSESVNKIDNFLRREEEMGLRGHAIYERFSEKIISNKIEFLSLINKLKDERKIVVGYGASTKGNVILQYCGINKELIPCIAEINSDKFNCYTPGTNIPIVSEKEARAMNPDYFLVFPWHFKSNIIRKENEFLKSGGKMIFPLPKVQIIGASCNE